MSVQKIDKQRSLTYRETFTLLKETLKEQKTSCSLLVISLLFDVIFNIGIASATSVLINQIENFDKIGLYHNILIFFVLGLILLFVSSLYPYFQGLIQIRSEKLIATKLYKKVTEFDYAFASKLGVSDTITRIVHDSSNTTSNLITNNILIAYNIVLFLGAAIYLLQIQWILVIVVILSGLLTLFFVQKYSSLQRNLSAESQKIYSLRRSILQDYMENIEYIKIFNQEEEFLEKYTRIQKEEYSINIKQMRVSGVIDFCLSVFNQFIYIACLGTLALLTIRGEVHIGILSAFFLLIGKIQSPFMVIARSYSQMQSAFGSSERILELLNRDEKINSSSNYSVGKYEKNRETDILLSLENVSYSSEDNTFKFQNLNLEIKKNEIIAIIGESGSGKSTLLKLITGLLPIQSGKIKFQNEINDNKELYKYISYVPQEIFLFEGTVEENITYGNDITDKTLNTALEIANAKDFIKKFPNGINTELTELGKNISGGQRTRIGITRALVRETPILAIDEGTANIDTSTSMNIINNLLRLRNNGKSIIVITHKIDEINNFDKVFKIENGKLILIR